MECIEWRRELADSPTARLFAYVHVGTATGLALLVGLFLLVALPGLLVTFWHDPEIALLVALFLFVGGPISLAYLWPLLTEPSQRRPLLPTSVFSQLPASGILVATVVGACVHALVVWLFAIGPVFVLAAGVLVGSLGIGLFCTEGQIDPAARTATVGYSLNTRESHRRTVDLTTWTGFSRYQWGSIAIVRPRYARGTGRSKPRFLPMPADVADAARPVFEAAVAAESPDPERSPNPAVAATYVVFALGIAGLGVAATLLEVGPDGFQFYLLAAGALGGALLLGAAWREY